MPDPTSSATRTSNPLMPASLGALLALDDPNAMGERLCAAIFRSRAIIRTPSVEDRTSLVPGFIPLATDSPEAHRLMRALTRHMDLDEARRVLRETSLIEPRFFASGPCLVGWFVTEEDAPLAIAYGPATLHTDDAALDADGVVMPAIWALDADLPGLMPAGSRLDRPLSELSTHDIAHAVSHPQYGAHNAALLALNTMSAAIHDFYPSTIDDFEMNVNLAALRRRPPLLATLYPFRDLVRAVLAGESGTPGIEDDLEPGADAKALKLLDIAILRRPGAAIDAHEPPGSRDPDADAPF